jgi:thioredoxin reductase
VKAISPGIPPGVYAAGDIAMYPVKLKLIGPGTAEGMAAVTRTKQYIREQFPHP